MSRCIAVALSGGVDSLVAGFLLKQKTDRVVGIHFTTGFEQADPDDSSGKNVPGSNLTHTLLDHLKHQLNIDVIHIDCKDAFRRLVVDYFIQTYQSGQTPNPCLVCNPLIKFGVIRNAASKLGAEELATGHYARTAMDPDGQYHLLTGVDPQKDQSYFLSRMTQNNLKSAMFPLGTLTKSRVREIAAENSLIPFSRNESQDVCFIKNMNYADFISRQGEIQPEPGLIVDVQGRVLGKHSGLHRFTVGQRRGINVPAANPYYVVRLDAQANRLIVGWKEELAVSECRVTHINWIEHIPSGPIEISVRLRYRHQATPALLIPESGHTSVRVCFEKPQAAVTPGQGAVFYQGEVVLGGGFISSDFQAS
ncbi:MAG: tRNA 2-thiouridine(34) synthase MnmA [Desulfatirhabdiaceae bacterium]